MGKLIWNEYGSLYEKLDSPTSFLTGANLRKKDPKKKPEKKPKKKQR
jgi:hypothetical protein